MSVFDRLIELMLAPAPKASAPAGVFGMSLARRTLFAAMCATTLASQSVAAQQLEMTNINMGILPTADYAPAIIAQQEGFFEKEGLKVTIRNTTTATVVPGLLGGEFHISGVNWIAYLLATNRKIDLVTIGELDRGAPGYTSFLVRENSDIKSINDLLGKKVAVVALNGNCDILLNEALRQRGLDFKSVRYLSVPVPDMGPTLARDGVDAACVPEPLLSVVNAQGGVRSVMDLFAGVGDGFPITGFATTADFAKKNPNTLAALRRAVDKGRELASRDPARVRAALPTYTAIKPDLAERLSLPSYPAKTDLSKLAPGMEMMKRFGLLPPDARMPVLVGETK